MTNRVEEKLKEFDKEFPVGERGLFENDDKYNLRRMAIKSFIEKALTDLTNELEDKVVGEERVKTFKDSDRLSNSEFKHYSGVCDGYNQKRNEVKQAFKEFNLK